MLFGFILLLFLFGGVIENYFDFWEVWNLELIVELCRSLYVDDLVSGKFIVKEV